VAIVENRFSSKTAIRRFTANLPGEQTRKADVEVWAYCLMPNHVHLILNPRQADGLGRAVGEAPRRYTNFINHGAAGRGTYCRAVSRRAPGRKPTAAVTGVQLKLLQ
jgi:REP element-mobilizing transposase RayT